VFIVFVISLFTLIVFCNYSISDSRLCFSHSYPSHCRLICAMWWQKCCGCLVWWECSHLGREERQVSENFACSFRPSDCGM